MDGNLRKTRTLAILVHSLNGDTRIVQAFEGTGTMEVIGAVVGGLIAWAISIPIFGVRGGRMVRPGVIEFDPAKGDVPPGGCLKNLANLVFIALGAVVGAIVASGMG